MLRRVVFICLLCALITGQQCGLLPDAGPAADVEPIAPLPRVTIQTSSGTIVIELFSGVVPLAVSAFLDYINEEPGYYDGTIFHEVRAGQRIIGGRYSEDIAEISSRDLVNESNSGMTNLRGRVALYGPSDTATGVPRFLINLSDNPDLDFDLESGERMDYTVIGRVVSGMSVADAIGEMETQAGTAEDGTSLGFLPAETVHITRMTADTTDIDAPPTDAPTADAGSDQVVNVGDPVTLDGSLSTGAAPTDTLTFNWVQTGGPDVSLDDPASATPTFTPDQVSTLVFELTVTDGDGDSATDSVVITAKSDDNMPPLADAGSDQTATVRATVTLDGSLSSDPDAEDVLTYEWTQTSGTTVTLSDSTAAQPTFTAPDAPATLVFKLTVRDGRGGIATDSTVVTVKGGSRVRLITSLGDIVLELLNDEAPITTDNFLQYVRDGFYDGTIFHRVGPDFMVQGGGFLQYLPEQIPQEGLRDPIVNESSPDRPNLRGTVSMARTSDPDSATSQFFINVADNPSLDNTADSAGYAVFARVIEGIEVADAMTEVEAGESIDASSFAPAVDIVIVAALEESGDGFATTSSGLKLKDVIKGTGDVVTEEDTIRAFYTGRLTDGNGEIFDTTNEDGEAREFSLAGVIDGWTEGLGNYNMRVGGTRFLIIPPELAYGDQERAGIPANSTLWFEVDVIAIVGDETSELTPVNVDLEEEVGLFQAQAGETVENSGTANVDTAGIPVQTGTISIDPSLVTVTPTSFAANAKRARTAQDAENTLEVTAWIAPLEDLDTVCGGDSSEEYGPYTLTLDADNHPVSVTPESVTISENTLNLITSGEFSLCLRIVSTIDATIRIEKLTFNVGV